MIELEKARWRLAAIWFPTSALIFLILILQSHSKTSGEDLQRLWGWALPNFLPTLGLMLSIFAAAALQPLNSKKTFVRRPFFNLAIGLSAFYLLTLLGTILSPPLLHYLKGVEGGASRTPMEILESSNLYLGPLQSMVTVCLGILFFLKERASTAPDG